VLGMDCLREAVAGCIAETVTKEDEEGKTAEYEDMVA
jgi:hypothetical protein